MLHFPDVTLYDFNQMHSAFDYLWDEGKKKKSPHSRSVKNGTGAEFTAKKRNNLQRLFTFNALLSAASLSGRDYILF